MKHYDSLIKTIELCHKYYDEKTFKHSLRVANYVVGNVCLVSDDERVVAFLIAMCHDLLEDTTVKIEEIAEATGISVGFLSNTLGALTKKHNEKYIDYINRLKSNKSKYPYLIKLADMKDHLSQTETLTDKLKDKYWKALPHLL